MRDPTMRSRAAKAVGVAVFLACSSSRDARAGGGAATDAYDDIVARTWLDVHAMADLYVQHDFANPPAGLIGLRAFDTHSDAVRVNLFRLTVARAPDWLGFRVDLGVGDLPDAYVRT